MANENEKRKYGLFMDSHDENNISKRSLAQRLRRERERNEATMLPQNNEVVDQRKGKAISSEVRVLDKGKGKAISSEVRVLDKGKGKAISTEINVQDKGKEMAHPPNVFKDIQYIDENNISKRCLAQRLRRERKENEGTILPFPPQSRFFPSLTPSTKVLARRRRTQTHMILETPSQIEIRRGQITPLTDITNQIQLLRHDLENENSILPPRNLGGEFGEVVVVENENSILLPRNLGGEFLETRADSSIPNTSCVLHNVPNTSRVLHNAPNTSRALHNSQGRHYMGKMDILCPFCSSLHWMDEKLSSSSSINPKFGKCCLQGKIVLPLLTPPPPIIQKLYDENDANSKSFRTHIRDYNNANAFTSLGSTMEPRTFNGRGPIPFTIHGELRHRSGSLIPESSNEASYAQLYIYDPDSALDIRDRRNPRCKREVMKIIQDALLEYNDFSKKYRQAYDILKDANQLNQNIHAYLHYSSVKDRRRYNLPSADEIAIILPGDGTEISGIRDIVIHLKGNHGLVRINECHPAYLPLHYVLLFPHGELGWEPNLTQWDVANNRPSVKRLTQLEWYSYRLFERPTEYSTILRAHKVFQEFCVDAWAATEQNRLRYYRLNQDKLRAELYQDLTEVEESGLQPDQVGQRFILPSSFTGSPRYMFEIYQDSLAITRYNKHPDFFVTMTANPNWTEITESLLPNQIAFDRPDLVSRVFELKRRHLMKIIKTRGIFGESVAHVFTIEFQKRGLPHMHALIFLQQSDKIRTVEQVDRFVSAEFPDEDEDPLLYKTVKNCMLHGPCGIDNPNAQCMENGKCTKRYRRPYAETTTIGEDGYPTYRRRDNGKVHIVRDHAFDNRDVVPHNPYLSRLFDCHINVEVCAGLQCVKYIHKYIYKGYDRTTIVLVGSDEIQQYLDARYIGPPEATWRIFGHPMHAEVPNVVRLALHLPGMHRVVFNPSETMEEILSRAGQQTSTLMAFFKYYLQHQTAPIFTYQDFPQHFVYNKPKGEWHPRKQGFAIGRMYFASPNSGEKFYLRLLLTVVEGPQSFEHLRDVNGHPHETFKSACIARGLLEDDGEWIQCLEEASVMKTGYQLRRLFSVILIHCSPLEPHELWNRFSKNICDDLAYKLRAMFGISNPTEIQVTDYGLYLLNQLLQESGKSLSDFPPMSRPVENWSTMIGNRLLWEHRQLQYNGQEVDAQRDVALLNGEQSLAYNAVVTSVVENKGILFFLNGGAGTGKTFVYNTIAAKCRSLGHIVITVASSGIASLLLVGGRTAHSTFCIPLDVLENSNCGFTKQSLHAELFRKTKLIIWDEVPMQHRYCIEAVDRTLQDIRDCKKPFGGITVVLGGDFRQTLPVIPKGVREQFVAASLRRSQLWTIIQVLTLIVNMRLVGTDSANVDFAKFLNEIGTTPCEIVQLPQTIHRCRDLSELLYSIYPRLNEHGTISPEYLTERTILSARNDDVNTINSEALNIFQGEAKVYLAADKIVEDGENNNPDASRYPNEYLNSLDPSGLPPFKLELKVGCPIMLLRNLAPKDGLCNGTRLIVVRCMPRVIEAQILTGDKAGSLVFLPRISLSPSSSELPIQMSRRQFPVRLAYAMTINKSQGQSVKFVGVDLRTSVFSHGQLYVALSRCTASNRLHILLPESELNNCTTNIVYPENLGGYFNFDNVNLLTIHGQMDLLLLITIRYLRCKGVRVTVSNVQPIKKKEISIAVLNRWDAAVLQMERQNVAYKGFGWGGAHAMVAVRINASPTLIHISTWVLYTFVRSMYEDCVRVDETIEFP